MAIVRLLTRSLAATRSVRAFVFCHRGISAVAGDSNFSTVKVHSPSVDYLNNLAKALNKTIDDSDVDVDLTSMLISIKDTRLSRTVSKFLAHAQLKLNNQDIQSERFLGENVTRLFNSERDLIPQQRQSLPYCPTVFRSSEAVATYVFKTTRGRPQSSQVDLLVSLFMKKVLGPENSSLVGTDSLARILMFLRNYKKYDEMNTIMTEKVAELGLKPDAHCFDLFLSCYHVTSQHNIPTLAWCLEQIVTLDLEPTRATWLLIYTSVPSALKQLILTRMIELKIPLHDLIWRVMVNNRDILTTPESALKFMRKYPETFGHEYSLNDYMVIYSLYADFGVTFRILQQQVLANQADWGTLKAVVGVCIKRGELYKAISVMKYFSKTFKGSMLPFVFKQCYNTMLLHQLKFNNLFVHEKKNWVTVTRFLWYNSFQRQDSLKLLKKVLQENSMSDQFPIITEPCPKLDKQIKKALTWEPHLVGTSLEENPPKYIEVAKWFD